MAARVLRELRFYLVPLDADGVSTHGLVTAFFDDRDEPLVIRTPLLDDEMGSGIFDLLCLDEFDIHFFDEQDRELLGYRVQSKTADSFRSSRDTIRLASPMYIPSTKIDDQMSEFISNRSQGDDENAIVVDLMEELFPSDFMTWDIRSEVNSYQGRRHPMVTSLERGDPGVFSELDIVNMLLRGFPSDQVFLNPLRADNGREFVDVMVATRDNLLLIQAKDSPNTEESLSRPIERKISTVLRHLRKATSQLLGSISYVQSSDPFIVRCGDAVHRIASGSLNVTSLIIARELFPTEYKSYSQLAFKVFDDTRVPCFIQDYSQFHCLTHHRRTEEGFFDTLDEIFMFAICQDEFPRPRFWL